MKGFELISYLGSSLRTPTSRTLIPQGEPSSDHELFWPGLFTRLRIVGLWIRKGCSESQTVLLEELLETFVGIDLYQIKYTIDLRRLAVAKA